jgi:hypothetical protein
MELLVPSRWAQRPSFASGPSSDGPVEGAWAGGAVERDGVLPDDDDAAGFACSASPGLQEYHHVHAFLDCRSPRCSPHVSITVAMFPSSMHTPSLFEQASGSNTKRLLASRLLCVVPPDPSALRSAAKVFKPTRAVLFLLPSPG